MNGSGKTTFIKLLIRLYDPTEGGEILLNGIDIKNYDYDEYLRIFFSSISRFQIIFLWIRAKCGSYCGIR